jgi:NAD(P)-dependent dehydrogenase (short-subunit alcohol dehydrogenase family)
MSKTVLITGASSGFGRDAAQTLAHAGHRVFASMRAIADRNGPHAEALRARGIHVVELDVTDDASVERGVAEVFAEAKRLDVLVNNAGIGSAGVSEAFATDQVRALFDVNVFGIQRMLRAVLPAFRRQGEGLVVNIGSILGRVTFPFLGLYGASKFAVEALTDSYRYELSQLGVDVVLVQPSAYPTNFFANIQQPAETARGDAYGEIGAIPAKMFETFKGMLQGENAPNPHDVAEAIRRLVEQSKGSRPARTVVGQPFGVDAVNDQTAPIQAQVVEGLGLGQLAAPPRAQAAAA